MFNNGFETFVVCFFSSCSQLVSQQVPCPPQSNSENTTVVAYIVFKYSTCACFRFKTNIIHTQATVEPRCRHWHRAGSVQSYLLDSTKTQGFQGVEEGKGQSQRAVQIRQTNPKKTGKIKSKGWQCLQAKTERMHLGRTLKGNDLKECTQDNTMNWQDSLNTGLYTGDLKSIHTPD